MVLHVHAAQDEKKCEDITKSLAFPLTHFFFLLFLPNSSSSHFILMNEKKINTFKSAAQELNSTMHISPNIKNIKGKKEGGQQNETLMKN